MTSILVLVVLLAADGGVLKATRSPRDITAEWLTALAHRDSPRIRHLSTFPLLVEGFQSNDKPDKNPCDRVPGMKRDPKTSEIRVSAASDTEFDGVMACVMSDNAAAEWVDRVSGASQFRGALRILKKPDQSSRRLARYRKEISTLPKPRVIVEAVEKHDGVTVSALVVLRTVASGAFAVEAVHSDFLFEE
jgi:hypothetical protein